MRALSWRPGSLRALALLLLFFALPGTAMAAGTPIATGVSTVAVQVNAGSFSGSVGSPSSPGAVTLSSIPVTTNYTLPVTVSDHRGLLSSGWNLSITSTQFTTGGATPYTLPTTASSILLPPTVTCTSPTTPVPVCVPPVNTVVFPFAVPADPTAPTPVEFYNAATSTGLGDFTITPTITVTVPPATAPGTYTSTVTVSVAAGP